MIRVTLPYPPLGNRLWRSFNGRIVLSPEARAYKERVGWLLSGQTPMAGAVRVTGHVFRPRKAGDCDATVKIILDALQGRAYANDNQVVAIEWIREDDKHNPRVEVTVEALGSP